MTPIASWTFGGKSAQSGSAGVANRFPVGSRGAVIEGPEDVVVWVGFGVEAVADDSDFFPVGRS